jgi:hypothetical protein
MSGYGLIFSISERSDAYKRSTIINFKKMSCFYHFQINSEILSWNLAWKFTLQFGMDGVL